MASDNIQIGKNIRDLRKATKETQQELGKAIGVEHNTISMYESGKRQPDLESLQAMAAHYGFPVDRLLYDDFSEVDLNIDGLTWEKAMSVMESMFPIVCSDKAMQDEHFAKGHAYTIRIRNTIGKSGSTVMRSMLERALAAYQDSLSQSGTVESAANMLWLIFVCFSLLPDEHSEKIGEAVLFGKALEKDFVKKYVLKDAHPVSKRNEDNKKAYIQESYESTLGLIKVLKESEQYADLADYYLALRYVVGMAENDYTDDLNKTIGMEMMTSLMALGNPYAVEFINKRTAL